MASLTSPHSHLTSVGRRPDHNGELEFHTLDSILSFLSECQNFPHLRNYSSLRIENVEFQNIGQLETLILGDGLRTFDSLCTVSLHMITIVDKSACSQLWSYSKFNIGHLIVTSTNIDLWLWSYILAHFQYINITRTRTGRIGSITKDPSKNLDVLFMVEDFSIIDIKSRT
ncbi:uncharacterized protein BT62DRAFT_1008764 [Guyanagaster necrorhizus]|uniref:Uncharacterized protein n=1 Tax=Guyanagaster necrorhizus TaxID=856835 RepID=A0A9P7VN01_9AGAR|nr:uncharacterized protein BT62DRAFT_1008764 [Guyanagaster necrorhizus MCA 3950]KAG7443709.1 hypothetical protein BT62DRAFT_1008764 [Guyanagaster necrorhizus MCA 3950]